MIELTEEEKNYLLSIMDNDNDSIDEDTDDDFDLWRLENIKSITEKLLK